MNFPIHGRLLHKLCFFLEQKLTTHKKRHQERARWTKKTKEQLKKVKEVVIGEEGTWFDHPSASSFLEQIKRCIRRSFVKSWKQSTPSTFHQGRVPRAFTQSAHNMLRIFITSGLLSCLHPTLEYIYDLPLPSVTSDKHVGLWTTV